MDLFAESNYKEAIYSVLQERRREGNPITLHAISEKIPIQYTYLSKVLRGDRAHLNEDHLFRISKILSLPDDERDFLLLLRAQATAEAPERKKWLTEKIQTIRTSKQLKAKMHEFDASRVRAEMQYLLDPYALIIHVGLNITGYRDDPLKLGRLLGLKHARTLAILGTLEDLHFIRLAPSRRKVTELLESHFHIPHDHPLQRGHQHMVRLLSAENLLKEDKPSGRNFMVTFAADPEAQKKILAAFETFIASVEKIALASRKSKIYQLNFDFFDWNAASEP